MVKSRLKWLNRLEIGWSGGQRSGDLSQARCRMGEAGIRLCEAVAQPQGPELPARLGEGAAGRSLTLESKIQ